MSALLVGSFALFSWGCGSDNNDFVVGGGITPSPSVFPSVFPSIIPSQTVTLTGVTVPAGATAAQVRILGANGQVLATVPGTINPNGTITFTVPSGLTGFTGVQVVFTNATGAVVGTTTAPLTPGQTTAAVGAVAPSNLVAVTVSAGSASTNMTVGQTLQLVTVGTYQSGGANITANVTGATFASSNATVANVSQTGTVTALSPGNTTVSATLPNPAGGNQTGAIGITVSAGPTGSPSPAASPTASPGSSPTSSPTASPTTSPTPAASPSAGQLILSTTNATTVVGGNVVVTGTINGAAQNLTLTVGNTGVASVSGSNTTSPTLTGVATGTTNFTATAGGQSVQGTITVADGTLQSTLVISPGTALTVNEGDQRNFKAFAQFSTPGGAVVQTDVTNQALWIVTNTTAQNLGEAISFDAGAGNFTATRGQAGTLQVGALFSNASGVAVGNTQVTVNRTNPTVAVRPVLSTETNLSRVPAGGWSRLYEAVATYPSGFSKVLRNANGLTDVTWAYAAPSAAANASAPTSNFTTFGAGFGTAEVVTNTVPQIGQVTLTATYTNSASGLAGGNHTVSIISYQLQNTTAGFAPTLPNDLRVIPGKAAANNGFLRSILVTCNFLDRNQVGNNLVMPIFTPPGASVTPRAGAMSLYLNPGAFPATTTAFTGNLLRQARDTTNTTQLLTALISPVGYSHLVRNITTGIYNQNVLNVRLQYVNNRQGLGFVSGAATAEVVGATTTPGGDRDVARTGTMANVTIDGNTQMTLTVANRNLRKGQATNATATAQYVGVGGASEVINGLVDFSVSGVVNGSVRVGNVTNGIGEVKGRVDNTSTPASGQGIQPSAGANITARYPHPTAAFVVNTALNLTLP